MWTPGINFILRGFVQIAPLASAIYIALTFVPSDDYQLSVLSKLAVCLTGVIIDAFVRRLWQSFQSNRAMKKLNARPFPVIKSEKFLGYDLLSKLLEEERTGYIGRYFSEWTEEYGRTYAIELMGDSFLFTTEPDYIKRLLATEFDNFEKGKRFTDAMQSVLGTGVFNADGELWKFHRGMTRPFFSRDRISDFDLFARNADIAIAKATQRLAENEALDFQDLVSRFTMDSATEFLFGSNVSSLSATLPYAPGSPNFAFVRENAPSEIFSKAFFNAQHQIAQRARKGWLWPIQEIRGDVTQPNMKTILDFIDPIIDQALKTKKERQNEVAHVASDSEKVLEGETLLSHLVKSTDDRVVLRDETLNILIAGRDTTAALLTFGVYALAIHPEITTKLRQEVLARVGPTQNPTYEDVKNMKYLRAFLNETLRLFPPVPFDVRATLNPTAWPSPVAGEKPYFVPSKTSVNYSALHMHRSTDLWGPDALQFDPNRFIDERLQRYLIPNPYIFLPFNAGPRICLGQQFAYNEASVFLIRLLQTFSKFTLARDVQPADSIPPAAWRELDVGRSAVEQVWFKSHLTMSIKGGLWVRMEEASAKA